MEKGDTTKDQKKDWADMEEDDVDNEEEIGAKAEVVKEVVQPKKAVVKAAGPKPQKNAQGDFIVTKFDVELTMNMGRKKVADSDEDKNDDKLSISDDLGSDSGDDQEEEKEADTGKDQGK